jgi:SET domain-containing protein
MYYLEVKRSTIAGAGEGLFALKDFKRKDLIAKYEGEVLTKAQTNTRYGNTQQDLAPYGIQASKNKIIDASCKRGVASYANSKPNHQNATFSVYQGHEVRLIASKNIKKGDEVFVSYGRDYFNHGGGGDTSHKTNKHKLKIP